VARTGGQEAQWNLWVHGGWQVSTFSDPGNEGLAPVDDRVEVYPARTEVIDVVVSVQPASGWTPPAVAQAVTDAIDQYLREVVFRPKSIGSGGGVTGADYEQAANDVIYAALGAVIQSAPGVLYYDPATFRVNGATANVAVWKGAVAVPGVYTITTP